MAAHLYVYYRVTDADDAATAAGVDRVIDRVRAATGIAGCRRRRRDEPRLWMEIYEGIADVAGFTVALDTAVRAVDLARHLGPDERRHAEWFEDPPPCA